MRSKQNFRFTKGKNLYPEVIDFKRFSARYPGITEPIDDEIPLDENLREYCWKCLGNSCYVVMFRPSPREGVQTKSKSDHFINEPGLTDRIEQGILDSFYNRGYRYINREQITSITWNDACKEGVILVADKHTRDSSIWNLSSRFFVQNKSSVWPIIKEVAKSRFNGILQVDLYKKIDLDSRTLCHYRKVLDSSDITFCIPKLMGMQQIMWIHSKYAIYNDDYVKLCRAYFWINTGLDDARLQVYMSNDKAYLANNDQFLFPIKNTITGILEHSKNKAMSKADLLKTIRLAYNSIVTTQTILSRAIAALLKENNVKIVNVAAKSKNKYIPNSNNMIVQLIGDEKKDFTHECLIPGQPCGVLQDVPLYQQIIRLILASKTKGITTLSIAANLNGVNDRIVEYCLMKLIKLSNVPEFPFMIYRTSVHFGKERMYLYYCKKKCQENGESDNEGRDGLEIIKKETFGNDINCVFNHRPVDNNTVNSNNIQSNTLDPMRFNFDNLQSCSSNEEYASSIKNVHNGIPNISNAVENVHISESNEVGIVPIESNNFNEVLEVPQTVEKSHFASTSYIANVNCKKNLKNESNCEALEKSLRFGKKFKESTGSEVTLTTLNRRNLFLKMVLENKMMDRSQLRTMIQNEIRDKNNVDCTIDRKTIDRDANFLCNKGLITHYVSAISKSTGASIIKNIYLSPDVDINSSKFKEYIDNLKIKPNANCNSSLSQTTNVVQEISYDKFSNWISERKLIENNDVENFRNAMPAKKVQALSSTPNKSINSAATTRNSAGKDVPTFIFGMMLKAKHLHLVIIRNYLSINPQLDASFNCKNIINVLKASDILRFIHCKSPPVLKFLISKLLEDELNSSGNSNCARLRLMERMLCLIGVKIMAIITKLLLILESLQVIEAVDRTDLNVETKNFKVVRQVPFINFFLNIRATIERIDIRSTMDFEYYWNRLQFSCIFGKDLIKNVSLLNKNMVLKSYYKGTPYSYDNFPHHPGYLFSLNGDILCALWRSSNWKNKRVDNNASDEGINVDKDIEEDQLSSLNSEEMDTVDEPDIANEPGRLNKYNFYEATLPDKKTEQVSEETNPIVEKKMNISSEDAQDKTNTRLGSNFNDFYSLENVAPPTYSLIQKKISRKLYLFNDLHLDNGDTLRWTRRQKENIIYAIAILNTIIGKNIDDDETIMLISKLLAKSFDFVNLGRSQIQKRLIIASERDINFYEYISELSMFYLNINNGKFRIIKKIEDINRETLSLEIKKLRNAHLKFFRKFSMSRSLTARRIYLITEHPSQASPNSKCSTSHDSHTETNSSNITTNVMMKHQKGQMPTNQIHEHIIPRTVAITLKSFLLSKSFNICLDAEDQIDDGCVESDLIDTHDCKNYSLQTLIRIITLTPQEYYDPLKALILLSAFSKEALNSTTDYLWKRRTICKLRRVDVRNKSTSLKTIIPSEHFVMGISNAANFFLFKNAGDLYKRQINSRINTNNSINPNNNDSSVDPCNNKMVPCILQHMNPLTPLHTSHGGILLLLSQMSTSQIRLETYFPQYILDNIKRDSNDSLDYAGFSLYEKFLAEFDTHYGIHKNNLTDFYKLNANQSKKNVDNNSSDLDDNVQNVYQTCSFDFSSVGTTVESDDVNSGQKEFVPNYKILTNKADSEIKKFYSRETSEAEHSYTNAHLCIEEQLYYFPDVDSALNNACISHDERVLLRSIVEVLDNAGSSGLTESEIHTKLLHQYNFDHPTCEKLIKYLNLSMTFIIGSLGRSLVLRLGTSRVYYVSYNYSIIHYIKIPSKKLWMDIVNDAHSNTADILEHNKYKYILENHFTCEVSSPTVGNKFSELGSDSMKNDITNYTNNKSSTEHANARELEQPHTFEQNSKLKSNQDIILLPARIWYNLNAGMLTSLWVSVCKSVAIKVANYPGISEVRLYQMVSQMLTRAELREVIYFLLKIKVFRIRCFVPHPKPTSIMSALNMCKNKNYYIECNPSKSVFGKITYLWPAPAWLLYMSAF